MSCVCDSHLSVSFYFIFSFFNCAGLGTPNGAVEQHVILSQRKHTVIIVRSCIPLFFADSKSTKKGLRKAHIRVGCM